RRHNGRRRAGTRRVFRAGTGAEAPQGHAADPRPSKGIPWPHEQAEVAGRGTRSNPRTRARAPRGRSEPRPAGRGSPTRPAPGRELSSPAIVDLELTDACSDFTSTPLLAIRTRVWTHSRYAPDLDIGSTLSHELRYLGQDSRRMTLAIKIWRIPPNQHVYVMVSKHSSNLHASNKEGFAALSETTRGPSPLQLCNSQ